MTKAKSKAVRKPIPLVSEPIELPSRKQLALALLPQCYADARAMTEGRYDNALAYRARTAWDMAVFAARGIPGDAEQAKDPCNQG